MPREQRLALYLAPAGVPLFLIHHVHLASEEERHDDDDPYPRVR